MDVDTIVFAISNKTYIFGKGKEYCIIPLYPEKPSQWNEAKQYHLLFDDLMAETLPEGVYEIYLLPRMPAKKKMITTIGSDHSSFLGLLNLYNLNAPDKPKGLSINATKVVQQMLSASPEVPAHPCLIIYFRGNEMPDKKIIPHTGRLVIGKIRLIEL